MVSCNSCIYLSCVLGRIRIFRKNRGGAIFCSLAGNNFIICNSHKTKKKIMDIGVFIIGFIIFCFYVYFLIWNIFNGTKKQREENNYGLEVDNIDMDGMGNFNRFGN